MVSISPRETNLVIQDVLFILTAVTEQGLERFLSSMFPPPPEFKPSEKQVHLLETLSDVVSGPLDQFAFGSNIRQQYIRHDAVILFYKDKETYGGAQLPLSNADVQALLTLAKPLRHGIGNDIVTDPAYRQVKEIATPNFSLSPDPMMQMGLLASVQARLADPGPLRAELHKLYIHGEGGPYEPDPNAPQENDYRGSLLLSIPSTYTGGSLVVRQNGSEIPFDWSRSADIEWVFLAQDCDYEVLPITSGHRVTVEYRVFETDEALSLDISIDSDTRSTVYTSMLMKLLIDRCQPLKLGFGLQHKYPDGETDCPAKWLILRGNDELLWSAATELELQPELRVVWGSNFYDEYEGGGESPLESWTRRSYQTSDDTEILRGLAIGDMWVQNHLMNAGAEEDKEILWLAKPKHFDNLVWYLPDDYDAIQMKPARSGVAIMIDIPTEPTNTQRRLVEAAEEDAAKKKGDAEVGPGKRKAEQELANTTQSRLRID